MNLRVDLILETERRSANVVSVKSMARVACIVAPILVVLIVAWVAVVMINMNKDLADLRERWKVDEPKKQKAALLKKELAANTAIDGEIAGWMKSQTGWHKFLAELQKQVPAAIQLQDLRISHNLGVTNNVPARYLRMVLQGTAVGDDPDLNMANVQALKVRLEKLPPFSEVVEQGGVKVTRFQQPPDKDTPKNNRLFEISCTLKPRKFE